MRYILASLTALVALATHPDPGLTHHSWRCPPYTQVTLLKADPNYEEGKYRFKLKVTATNRCGCKIKFKICPKEKDGKCDAQWIKPGESASVVVRTNAADAKAKFDWRTHSKGSTC